MDTLRTYMVGLTSVTEGFINAGQLKEAVGSWRERPDRPISVILAERGWLSDSDRSTVEALVESELARQGEHSPIVVSSTHPSVADFDGHDLFEGTTTPRDVHVPSDGSSQDAPAIGQPPDPSEGSTDRYLSPQFHASGGMKVVYRVKDRKLGREVALAKLKPELAKTAEYVRRFVVEARITASLGHPNIVPIHDLNEVTRPPSYTMPFLEGRTFSAAIRQHHGWKAGDAAPEFSFRDLLTSFLGVCNAVAFAHEKGVIHRDLKGANVQIDTLGQTIVLDWGLARRLDDPLDPLARAADPDDTEDAHAHTYAPTRPGSSIGTPQYMPPEQAQGDTYRINTHSDVFGLGTMLYLILAGRPPYETTKQAAAVDFRPPSAHKMGLPKALEAVCLKAMQAKPEDRYASAEALAADVRRWLADEPVSVFPEPVATRTFRWARKHRPIVAGAAMLLVTAVAGLGIGLWRVEVEREKVEIERDEKVKALQAAESDAVAARWMISETRRIVGRDLAMIPHAEDARLNLAELNVRYARTFLAQHPVIATQARGELIPMLHEAANDYRNFGKFSVAAKLYAEAIRETEAILKAHPESTTHQELFSRIISDQATALLAVGHPAEAKLLLDAAESKTSEARKLNPTNANLIQVHAWVNFNRAELLRVEGRVDEGAKLLGDVLNDFEAIGGKATASVVDDFRLDWVRVDLGAALGCGGKTREAREVLDRAVRGLTKLHKTAPDHNVAFILSRARLERGRLLAGASATRAEAIEDLDAAIAAIDALSRDFPRFIVYRRALAVALTLRARVRADAARDIRPSEIPKAEIEMIEGDAGRAQTLLAKLARDVPDSDNYHSPLGDALTQLGRAAALEGRQADAKRLFAEAIQSYARAQKFMPQDTYLRDGLKRCQAEAQRV